MDQYEYDDHELLKTNEYNSRKKLEYFTDDLNHENLKNNENYSTKLDERINLKNTKIFSCIADCCSCLRLFRFVISSPKTQLKKNVDQVSRQHQQKCFPVTNKVSYNRYDTTPPRTNERQLTINNPCYYLNDTYSRNKPVKQQVIYENQFTMHEGSLNRNNINYKTRHDSKKSCDNYDIEIPRANLEIDQDALDMCQKLCDSIRGIRGESDLKTISNNPPTTKITWVNNKKSLGPKNDTLPIQNNKKPNKIHINETQTKSTILDAVTTRLGSITHRNPYGPSAKKHKKSPSLSKNVKNELKNY